MMAGQWRKFNNLEKRNQFYYTRPGYCHRYSHTVNGWSVFPWRLS